MNSLEDKAVYFGENAQWTHLTRKKCISKTVCFQEEERILDENLHLANGREQKITHKFCFAASTGLCSDGKGIDTAAASWDAEDFCPNWRVEWRGLVAKLDGPNS